MEPENSLLGSPTQPLQAEDDGGDEASAADDGGSLDPLQLNGRGTNPPFVYIINRCTAINKVSIFM